MFESMVNFDGYTNFNSKGYEGVVDGKDGEPCIADNSSSIPNKFH